MALRALLPDFCQYCKWNINPLILFVFSGGASRLDPNNSKGVIMPMAAKKKAKKKAVKKVAKKKATKRKKAKK